MFKSNDLYEKKVCDSKGKKLGYIKDIIIDFIDERICGFAVKNSRVDKNISYVNIDKSGAVVRSTVLNKNRGILLSKLKNMIVMDTEGREKGVINDLIIDKESLEVKGFILSSGKIDNIIRGREVILPRNIIIQDGYILYFGKANVIFKNVPHEINNFNHSERA